MKRPYHQLQFLILVFAFTAILGRMITLPAPILVMWRVGLAAIIMLVWLAISKRAPIKMDRPFVIRAVAIGFILGMHWITFFGSIQLANISICLAGMASTSFFTSLTEPLIERKRPKTSELLLGLMVIPGLLLVAGASWDHALGLGCALLSALFASLFPVLNRKFALTGIAPQTVTLYEMTGAVLVCATFATVVGYPVFDHLPTASDWLWLSILASVCTVWAFSFHIKLLEKFTAFTSNLAMNFEPVYGIILAAIIFREYEELHPLFYLGATCILAANIIHAFINKKSTQLNPAPGELPIN
ncbi:MAG: DMT family transporter [Verrucomicrobiae bacterium]|nr:DMT family transporter [Verrucomicrobiae bacterium]NNJ87486.1 DMT family transporter [Akkermansiaceae bacterium]